MFPITDHLYFSVYCSLLFFLYVTNNNIVSIYLYNYPLLRLRIWTWSTLLSKILRPFSFKFMQSLFWMLFLYNKTPHGEWNAYIAWFRFFYRNGDENNETRFNSHNYDYAALRSIVECVDLLTVDLLIKSCIIHVIHNSGMVEE